MESENHPKTHFVVMDFRNVTRLFADPDWDGPIEIDPGFTPGVGPVKPNPPVNPVDPPSKNPKPIVGRDGCKVEIIYKTVSVYDANGKLLRQESIVDYTKENILGEYASLDNFIRQWTAAEKKETIREMLRERGIDLEAMKADQGMSDVGDFDFICHVAFDKKPLTRRERANNVKKRDFLSKYSGVAREVLEKCDIDLFVARIENVTIEGKKKKAVVNAHYSEDHLNANEWCCVIYVLKNAGKTDISTLHMIWHFQQSSCIFPADYARQWAEGNLLNYGHCYDTKIRAGETISLKICYHKDAIVPGLFSAPFSIGMIDDNGRYWTQPLFAPQEKVYDSRAMSWREYKEQLQTKTAEECFKKPWLW